MKMFAAALVAAFIAFAVFFLTVLSAKRKNASCGCGKGADCCASSGGHTDKGECENGHGDCGKS
ncbi:hypothetical protein EP073_09565 [Geovibrio thiophilus]|uniref:FeoB-associated Cys-rich membrane protein n=1 Tax=Geovibrio thiophilus TaxID=139438 RepID=A0A410JZS5_9BACT|nr:hypothetical protein [Geovibrio thiophilus]QAR33639.1 hypothetical protein EP073_09565 [Geovibrio thiophilus]